MVLNLMGSLSDSEESASDNALLTDGEGLKILQPYLTQLLEYISDSVRSKQAKSSVDDLGTEFEVLSR